MREQPIRPNDCECGAVYSLDPRGVCIREAGSALWVDCGTCGRRTRTVNADKKTRQAAVRGIVREWNAGKVAQ